MDEAKRNEIRQWLIKSQHDLGSAYHLMEGEDRYPDTAVYHCQQAAEKAIKAYLTYCDTPFDKTHNLVALLAICEPLQSGFDKWDEVAEMLTPYATAFRYPGDVLEPEAYEVEEALDGAKNLVNFILKSLPDEVKP